MGELCLIYITMAEDVRMLRFPIVITIDTNIFDSTQYDFSENSKLGILLKYVKEEKIKVVLTLRSWPIIMCIFIEILLEV